MDADQINALVQRARTAVVTIGVIGARQPPNSRCYIVTDATKRRLGHRGAEQNEAQGAKCDPIGCKVAPMAYDMRINRTSSLPRLHCVQRLC